MGIAKTLVCLVVSFAILSGCALQEKEAQKLLARDYLAMSDQSLENYYRRLNDQLAGLERKTRRRGDEGEGAGVADMAATLIDELRQRRNAVRTELGRRNLRP